VHFNECWRGVLTPLSFVGMIRVETVQKLVEEAIAETDLFLVELHVGVGNAIAVAIDKDSGITVEDCKKVSRHIESSLDREIEDFSLEVSSPGVGKPLKVHRQFLKNTGRTVAVKLKDGSKLEGELEKVEENGIVIFHKIKETVPGKKTKQWVEYHTSLNFDQVEETKVIISFK
jgi:ribosome maturation factor RimP